MRPIKLWRIQYALWAMWYLKSWGPIAIIRAMEMAQGVDIDCMDYCPHDALREEFSVWEAY